VAVAEYIGYLGYCQGSVAVAEYIDYLGYCQGSVAVAERLLGGAR
jgi:hypothetical protein